MAPKVFPAVIRERMNRLWESKQLCLQRSANLAQGRVFPVIVERHGREGFSGTSPEGLRILFVEKPGKLGSEVQVKVVGFQDGFAVAHLVS